MGRKNAKLDKSDERGTKIVFCDTRTTSLWLVIGTQALAMIIFKGSVHGYNEKGSQQDGCFCYELQVFCFFFLI